MTKLAQVFRLCASSPASVAFQLFGLKWLLQGRAAAIGLRQAALAVAGDEHEGQAALGQDIRDRINLLAVEIDVEDGRAEVTIGRELSCLGRCYRLLRRSRSRGRRACLQAACGLDIRPQPREGVAPPRNLPWLISPPLQLGRGPPGSIGCDSASGELSISSRANMRNNAVKGGLNVSDRPRSQQR